MILIEIESVTTVWWGLDPPVVLGVLGKLLVGVRLGSETGSPRAPAAACAPGAERPVSSNMCLAAPKSGAEL